MRPSVSVVDDIFLFMQKPIQASQNEILATWGHRTNTAYISDAQLLVQWVIIIVYNKTEERPSFFLQNFIHFDSYTIIYTRTYNTHFLLHFSINDKTKEKYYKEVFSAKYNYFN